MNIANIKRKFEKSIYTYDANAHAQREIANKLHSLVLRLCEYKPAKIFEIGTGTGLLTKKIVESFPESVYMINDINEKIELLMPLLFKGTKYTFLPGDAQLIPYPTDVNLIISSSTIQWFDNLDNFAQKAHKSLSGGGYMFLSTFGENNLKEIREITGSGLNYATIDTICEIFSPLFDILKIEAEEITVKFATPADILEHLRNTGVNATNNATLRSRAELLHFCNNYATKFSHNGNVTLTYNPIYIALRKK